MSRVVDENLAKTFLVHFKDKNHLKNWVSNFLELDFPDSYVYEDSNSSPIDWMYEVYDMYRRNAGNESPEVIVISSRESYKTLSESVFAVIAMVHFGASLAHMAAIVPQATAAQSYINNFIQKIEPYLTYHKITLDSKNAKEISIKKEDGSVALMKIIVCTITGANSAHTNLFTVDEIDTIRSREGIRAYHEAQFIPGVFNGQHPITIKTSTLKFPGGLFSKEMDKAKKNNYKIFKWNIIDITEACPPSRHKPNEPKETRYIASRNLPLSTLTVERFDDLNEKEKDRYEKIEVMAGCAKCSLLPVCKGKLAARSKEDRGGLWKPIDFTISQFNKTDPDLAEAQLMCWKPSSQGMVYPRFIDTHDGTGNTYTLEQAWFSFTGAQAPKNLSITQLKDLLISKGVKIYVGADWGFSHAQAFVVSAILPNGEWWILDAYSIPGLEFDQILDLGKQIRDLYKKPFKWFYDSAQPAFIKSFKKNGMPGPDFKKDVIGGIEAVRGQIINAKGKRFLKVIKHQRTDIMLKMFAEHCFLLDTLGNLTSEPDDSDVADVADSLRYTAQNLFASRGKVTISSAPSLGQTNFGTTQPAASPEYKDWMSQKIRELSAGGDAASGKSSDGGALWSFGVLPDDE